MKIITRSRVITGGLTGAAGVVNTSVMRNKLLFITLIIFVSAPLISQELVLPGLEGYRKLTNYPVYTPENLYDFINGAADNYLAYNFVDLHVAEYKKGRQVVKLEIYKHSDHTTTFGIYSSERSPSFRFVNLGAQGYMTDGSINFFKGNYYVKIRTFSKKEKTLRAAEKLATKVAAMLEGEIKMPETLLKFPSEAKKPNEETYIHESVLGHKFLKKAFKAVYEAGQDKFAIYIIQNNSPEETEKTAATYLAATGIDQIRTGEGRFVLKDGYNGTVFLAWTENTIAIISGLAKDQTDIADRYISQIIR